MNPDRVRHNLNKRYPDRKYVHNQTPKNDKLNDIATLRAHGAITGKTAIDLSKEVEEQYK